MKISKSSAIYIGILAIIFGVYVIAKLYEPKPVDWTPTFDKSDKNPYGTFLVFERLEDIFPKSEISSSLETIYETQSKGSSKNYSYLIISNRFEPDKTDEEALLENIKEGGSAFIAAESFSQSLFKKLGFGTKNNWDLANSGDSVLISFIPPYFKSRESYTILRGAAYVYFSRFDSTSSAALAKNQHEQPILIHVQYGKGNLFLSTTPLAFCNYNLLKNKNYEFISNSFSYLPDPSTLIWVEYYQPIGYQKRNGINSSSSPLRFVLSQESLRSALYLGLVGILLFIFFEAKRKQRIIPLQEVFKNSTVEFTETIGRLYFQKKDHKNLADKKITYFLEYIRSTYYLKTTHFDSDFLEALSSKSGFEMAETKKLFLFIQQIRDRPYIQESELMELSTRIDQFKGLGHLQKK